MTLTATSTLKQTEPAQETQEETPAAAQRPNRRAVMVSAVLTQLMIVLDLTIIAIALPHMQEDLGMTVSQSPWTVTGYSLAFGGLVLFGGRLCAVVGIRRSYQVGLIGFGIASLAAGMATSFSVLLAARVAQGCFGACWPPPHSHCSMSPSPSVPSASGSSRSSAPLAAWERLSDCLSAEH